MRIAYLFVVEENLFGDWNILLDYFIGEISVIFEKCLQGRIKVQVGHLPESKHFLAISCPF